MNRVVLLDTGPLGKYANPAATPKNKECRQRVTDLLAQGFQVKAPRLAVYEVRRELVRLQRATPAAKRLERFDAAVALLGLLPLTDAVMDRAAVIWGEARAKNIITAPPEAFDGDVVIVAQAVLEIEKGDQVQIATTNSKDLGRLFVDVLALQNRVIDWDDLVR